MDDISKPSDPQHAIIPPFETDTGPPKKRSRKSSSNHENFTQAATPTPTPAAPITEEDHANNTTTTTQESYSTPLDIEPCGIRQIEEHIAFLEYELREVIRTKQFEIAYARGRIERLRTNNRHRRKRCIVEGCITFAMRGGVCTRHGATKVHKPCRVAGCANKAQVGGVCIRHGAVVKLCRVRGCGSQAHKGGNCRKHAAGRAECTFEGCGLFTDSGGMCGRHGGVPFVAGGRRRKRCSADGCTNNSLKGGVCRRHGAPFERCCRDGCTNKAKQGGLCVKHGAKIAYKRCKYEGCEKWAQTQTNGFCKRHFNEQWFTSESKICREINVADVGKDGINESSSDLDAGVKAKTEVSAKVWI